MELIAHMLEHALEDTLYLVPFLLITYLLLEALEHKAGNRAAAVVSKAGAAGPAVAALLGAVPQCGFSAAGSALFANRAITLGTLFAVLLSTSDEMLPLFIANQVDPLVMLGIVGTKVLIGMAAGFAIDAVLRVRFKRAHERTVGKAGRTGRAATETRATTGGAGGSAAEGRTADFSHAGIACASMATACASPDRLDAVHAHGMSEADIAAHEKAAVSHAIAEGHDATTLSHHHCHGEGCGPETASWKDVIISAVKHTLQVSVIVYLISLALVVVMELAGEDAIATFLVGYPGVAILGAAVVGLIPNCGASVVITQLYLDGMLGTGAMMAGLLVSAGVGLLVLFSENHNVKQNLAILAGLVGIGVLAGCLFETFGITFM